MWRHANSLSTPTAVYVQCNVHVRAAIDESTTVHVLYRLIYDYICQASFCAGYRSCRIFTTFQKRREMHVPLTPHQEICKRLTRPRFDSPFKDIILFLGLIDREILVLALSRRKIWRRDPSISSSLDLLLYSLIIVYLLEEFD